MSKAKVIASVALIVVALILMLMNTHEVRLHLPFAQVGMSMALFGFVLLALGFIAGALVGLGVAGRKASKK